MQGNLRHFIVVRHRLASQPTLRILPDALTVLRGNEVDKTPVNSGLRVIGTVPEQLFKHQVPVDDLSIMQDHNGIIGVFDHGAVFDLGGA
jgi:hypothetical protein